MGNIKATAGSIRFDGIELTQQSQKQMRSIHRRLQMITQNPFASLDPRMKVSDSILEGVRIQKLVRKSFLFCLFLSFLHHVPALVTKFAGKLFLNCGVIHQSEFLMHEAKVSSDFHPVKTCFLNAYPVFFAIFFKLEQYISTVRNIKSAKHSKKNCFSSSAYSDKR